MKTDNFKIIKRILELYDEKLDTGEGFSFPAETAKEIAAEFKTSPQRVMLLYFDSLKSELLTDWLGDNSSYITLKGLEYLDKLSQV